MAADTVTVDAAELAALRAIAAAVIPWYHHLTGADPIADAVRAHRDVLDPDPGLHRAWPEADEDPEPVAGINYLPAGEYVYNRVAEDADGPAHDRHTIGYSDDHRWYDKAGQVAA
jgi:hypothetical protein